MRIAFISLMGDAPWGGSEVLWTQTAAQALAEGHEVFFSAYQWPQTPEPLLALVRNGAHFHPRPRYRTTLSARLQVRVRQLLQVISPEVAAIRGFNPDLIVVNQGGGHDALYREDLRDLLLSEQYPYYLTCHSYRDPIRLEEHERSLLIRLFEGARRVFTISEQQTAVLQRQLAVRLSNNTIVQNPLNTPADWPLPFPNMDGQLVRFASIASLDADVKGQDILFEALSSKKWNQRAWELNLYGKGPDKAYLQRLAQYYGIEDRVNFRGYVADTGAIWALNHALLLSSRIESGPMVLAEAMLSGRPVVATPVGMVSEWVEEGVTGFIAKASLPHALETALEKCWAQQSRWAAMGQAATMAARHRSAADPVGEFLRLITSGQPQAAVSLPELAQQQSQH